jgi:pyrroline-5-carboxylate reductase
MKLGLIGAGNMASALARGMGEPVLVSDIDAERARSLAEATGGEAVASNAELAERADAVLLCHKPRQLDEVAAEVAGHTDTVVSILAATPTTKLSAAYPGAAIYRFIPNMPVEVGQGVLCYVRGPGASEGPEGQVLDLMGRAGELIMLDHEPLIEPAMALMSCGPAFMALWAESFAKAGEAHGLDREAAMRMVVETMAGSAAWLARHGYDGAELRARVATPGGTTEKGLIALEEGGLGDLVQATVDQVVEATR